MFNGQRVSFASLAIGLTAGVALALMWSGRLPRAAADDLPSPSAPMKVITADTDINRIDTIHITHSEKPKLSPCFLPPDYKAQKCMRVLKGPFVVTDVTPPFIPNPNAILNPGGLTLFVARTATEPEEERFVPRWRASVETAPIHGGRYQVRGNEFLFVADPPVDAFRTITVSGFRPY